MRNGRWWAIIDSPRTGRRTVGPASWSEARGACVKAEQHEPGARTSTTSRAPRDPIIDLDRNVPIPVSCELAERVDRMVTECADRYGAYATPTGILERAIAKFFAAQAA